MAVFILNTSVYDANNSTGYATVLVQGAGATINVTANSTGGASDIGNPATADFVLGATITDIRWSTDIGGSIKIARGANTYLVLSGSDSWSASNGWRGLQIDKSATIVVTAGANSTVQMGLKKVYR